MSLFDTGVQQALASTKNGTITVVRLGEVTSLDPQGRAKIEFAGESTESNKTYTYIEGYLPEVGDKVALIPQGDTWIILGCVTDGSPEEETPYVPSEDLSINTLENETTSLTLSGTSLLPQSTNEITLGSSGLKFSKLYVTSINLNGTDLSFRDVRSRLYDYSNDNRYIDFDSYAVTPSSSNSIYLGSSSSVYKNIYTSDLTLKGQSIIGKILCQYDGWYLEYDSNALKPHAPLGSNQATSLGTSAQQFTSCYLSDEMHCRDAYITRNIGSAATRVKKLYVEDIDASGEIIGLTGKASKLISANQQGYPESQNYIMFSSETLLPSRSQYFNLGTNTYQYKNCYAKQFYQNGTAITTSDKRKKKSIKDIGKKYIEFFKKLRPVTYKMKDGDSGRVHTGFIAQEVEEAMHENGVTNEEFAGLIITPEGDYALRYEEFIALQTKVIQDLTARVEELERRLNNG